MAKYTNLSSLFTAIADAIRAKKGTTDTIVADNFPDEIAGIAGIEGVDASGVTATASDVLSPKVIVLADGSEAIGTIETVDQATPSASIDDNGLVVVSATQSAGYVSSGTKKGTLQLITQNSKTITPGTSEQIAVSSGVYTTGEVMVKGDTNLVASNIKSGISIFGVTGSYSGGGARFGSRITNSSLSNTTVTFSGCDTTNLIGFYLESNVYLQNSGTSMIVSGLYTGTSFRVSIVSSGLTQVNLLTSDYTITTTDTSITIELTGKYAWFAGVAIIPIYSE